MTLSYNDIPEFKEWLTQNGWVTEPTKGEYEVLRARHANLTQPLIVFRKKDDTITFPKTFEFLLNSFYNNYPDTTDVLVITSTVFDLVTKSPESLVNWMTGNELIPYELKSVVMNALMSKVDTYVYEGEDASFNDNYDIPF